MSTTIVVNGNTHEFADAEVPGKNLLGWLRGDLGLTGTKPGCGEGECGACTVLLDGAPVLACQTNLVDCVSHAVTTIEGLASGEHLHPIQETLIEAGASQCGYCTPAMALRAAALLATNPHPDDCEIDTALDPNLCRCGCYPRLARAVRRAAELIADPSSAEGRQPVVCGTNNRSLGRPKRPWDLSSPDERDWFGVLGDGLVVVWPAPEPRPGMWSTSGGAWLHIEPTGVITAFTGKVDVGQDNTTAFRLLVAEEMGADFTTVRVVLGDTDLCPFDMGTFGSRSMPDVGEALRRLAGGAREIVSGLPGASAEERFASLEGERRVEVLGEEPVLRAPSKWSIAGTADHRPWRVDAVTGSRVFVSDIARPDMAYGAVLRPPVPGASLRSVDTTEAGRVAGVTVVEDGDFVGVSAYQLVAARRALALIRAEWDLPPEDAAADATDIAAYLRSHLAEGMGWERAMDETQGDVEVALKGASIRVDATYTTAYIAHTPLETRAAVAEWDGDRLTIWAGTQVPFGTRAQVAGGLGIDEADVRVIGCPTGGGFGGKHGGQVALEAARLARAVDRPVKVHWTRSEEFQWGHLRPMAVMDASAGLDSQGALVAWDFLNINAGAPGIVPPYAAANRRLRYQPAKSPLPQGSYRALAAVANHFARESLIDELAHEASVDPLEFRLAHLDDERLVAVVQAAAERFGWPPRDIGPAAGVAGAAGAAGAVGVAAPDSLRGWGIAAGLEKGGRVATCAEVLVGKDGTLRVERIVTAYECGAVVNPDTVVNQIEGGTVMALGGALFEEVRTVDGHIAEPTLSAYRVPRFSDTPQIEVVLLDRRDIPSAGAGETPLVAVAPAIANAIFHATGQRLRSLPLVPQGRVPGYGSA